MNNKGLFTIPFENSFLEDFVAQLLEETASHPLKLRDYTLFLPTRRSIRELKKTFLTLYKGPSLILPKMIALGEISEEELGLGLSGNSTSADDLGVEAVLESSYTPMHAAVLRSDSPANPLPKASFQRGLLQDLSPSPSLSPLKRQALLARLIKGFEGQGYKMTTSQAFKMAAELMTLIDQAILEDLDFQTLPQLVSSDFAAHWQITLDFLSVLTAHWPKILEEEGAVEPAKIKKLLIESLIQQWERQPSASPLIMVGSTGSMKLTRQLMKAILALPQGRVVLPGFIASEFAMALHYFTHPQHTMAFTVQDLGYNPEDVLLWPASSSKENGNIRTLSKALRPTLDTLQEGDALENVHRLDCGSEIEEASVIALILRETLETEGVKSIFITPDRTLARRVASLLKRWDIQVSDAAGKALSDTPLGILVRLSAELLINPNEKVYLASLLKHPLVKCGFSTAEFKETVYLLEKNYLRNKNWHPSLIQHLSTVAKEPEIKRILDILHPFLADFSSDSNNRLLAKLASERGFVGEPDCRTAVHVKVHEDSRNASTSKSPAEGVFSKKSSFSSLVATHMAFLKALMQTEGESPLSLKKEGENELGVLVQEIMSLADYFPRIDVLEYPSLLMTLMSSLLIHSPIASHSQISILSPLEARLMPADRVILGGLNEGTWPGVADPGPWLSRPMRVGFGLQPLEQRIGLAAHDFIRAFGVKEVYLTRSAKVQGSPSIPCRWLLRLETLLAMDRKWLDSSAHYLEWAKLIDHCDDKINYPPPAPRPPVNKRPQKLSVTQVEMWMRDPYAIYARHVLKLKKLESLAVLPEAADWGILIHACLERYKQGNKTSLEELMEIGRQEFAFLSSFPLVRQFWWSRFMNIAAWFVETDQNQGALEFHIEKKGQINLDSFTLTTKVDRIDRLSDHAFHIIDYKTGHTPTDKAIKLGYNSQLPLEGLIFLKNGFDVNGKIGSLQYWKVRGKENADEIISLANPETLIESAEAGLRNLIRSFNDERTPYRSQPRPEWAPLYSDYDHLARVQEWSGR